MCGMDPLSTSAAADPRCFPRMRGDGPVLSGKTNDQIMPAWSRQTGD